MSKNLHKENQPKHRALECLWYFLILGVVLFVTVPNPTQAFVALFTDEAIVVTQAPYPGGCTDLSEWTSSVGSCDKIVCYVEPSGPYTITHSCRPRDDYENPDDVNCQWISNTTLAFPDCCPKLQCASSTPIAAVNSSLCLDLATNYACGIWKNLTSGCSDPTSPAYNMTQTYCNNTCGFKSYSASHDLKSSPHSWMVSYPPFRWSTKNAQEYIKWTDFSESDFDEELNNDY